MKKSEKVAGYFLLSILGLVILLVVLISSSKKEKETEPWTAEKEKEFQLLQELAQKELNDPKLLAEQENRRKQEDIAKEAETTLKEDKKMKAEGRIIAENHISSRLRDPNSAVFEYGKIFRNDNGLFICGAFRAKNGFGGYDSDFYVIGMKAMTIDIGNIKKTTNCQGKIISSW